MILITDKSIVMSHLKNGTKQCESIYKENKNSHFFEKWGLDLIRSIEEKKFFKEINNKPFFIFIRDYKKLYRSQIIQSFKRWCHKNPSFDYQIMLTPEWTKEKEAIFKNITTLIPNFLNEFYSDVHYVQQTFIETLSFIQYIESNRRDIFNNLFILNLDNYDTSKKSLDLLFKYKVMNKKYLNSTIFTHTTKNKYLPTRLETIAAVEKDIFGVPFHLNRKGLELIEVLYSDKYYTPTKLASFNSNLRLL